MQALNTYPETQGTPSQPARGWSMERFQMAASATLDPAALKFIAVAVVTATGYLGIYADAGAGGLGVCKGFLPYKAVSDAARKIAIGGGSIDGYLYDTVEIYTSGVFLTAEITGLDAAAVADLGGHLIWGDYTTGEIIIPGAG